MRSEDADDLLARISGREPRLAGLLSLLWSEVERSFPGDFLPAWLAATGELVLAGLGDAAVLAYVRGSIACAASAGPEAAMALARTGIGQRGKAGAAVLQALFMAAPQAAERLRRADRFTAWLRVIEHLVAEAPDLAPLVLERTRSDLADGDVRGLEVWLVGVIRATVGDAAARRALFAAERDRIGFDGGKGRDLIFSDVQDRLRAYLTALWQLSPPLRSVSDTDPRPTRRAGFESGIIRVPSVMRGFHGEQAIDVFRAALAHIAAHFVFTRAKFPVLTLKPLQVATISLIEDARVEHLAMQTFPGLSRLWRPHHHVQPGDAYDAAIMLARLARALIDPSYSDGDGWVEKGRRLFFDNRGRWGEQNFSRSIGGLLANDLGQMRIQFNARTYVVEPPYRDDNMGLWDFGNAPSGSETAEMVHDSARFEEADRTPDRQREETEARPQPEAASARVRPVALDDQIGALAARYPEWDYLVGVDRPDWTAVLEFPIRPGAPGAIDRILERQKVLVGRVTSLIRSAKVSRPVRLRRQPEGDRLDLDACIVSAISRRSGETPDSRVYASLERRHRDLSALVLLDVSQSTNDIAKGNDRSVFLIEREATAILAHGMAELGDPFAIHAFCSNGREDVRYYRIKDFGDPFGQPAKARLAGLAGMFSTRMGPALRHAGSGLAAQRTHRRLLLVVTDGEPSDIDVHDRRYLVEDARKAVLALMHAGIDVFCVGLTGAGGDYLSHIFGRRNVLLIDRVERLPERLPMLYLRLAA
jgi:nitric oxide reductase NorD protein